MLVGGRFCGSWRLLLPMRSRVVERRCSPIPCLSLSSSSSPGSSRCRRRRRGVEVGAVVGAGRSFDYCKPPPVIKGGSLAGGGVRHLVTSSLCPESSSENGQKNERKKRKVALFSSLRSAVTNHIAQHGRHQRQRPRRYGRRRKRPDDSSSVSFFESAAKIEDRIDAIGRGGFPLTVKERNILINAAAQVPNPGLALAQLRETPQPDAFSFSAAIAACARSGDPAEAYSALSLFDEMLELGIAPDRVVYNSVLDVCSLRPRDLWYRALELFDEMRESGIEPDTVTFNAVASACLGARRLDEAVGILTGGGDDCADDGDDDGGDDAQLIARGDVVAARAGLPMFYRALNRCAQTGHFDGAIRLMVAMNQRGVQIDSEGWRAAMAACVVAGRWRETIALRRCMLKEAGADGARGGPKPSVHTARLGLTACLQLGLADEAVRCLRELEDGATPGGPDAFPMGGSRSPWAYTRRKTDGGGGGDALSAPDAHDYGAAISACARSAGDGVDDSWTTALNLLEAAKERGFSNKIVHNAAISVLVRHGQLDEAVRLFGKMGDMRDVVTYTTLVGGLGRDGQWERALQMHYDMRRAGVVPDMPSYRAILHVCRGAGRWREALSLLVDMLEAPGGVHIDADCYRFAMAVYEQSDEWAEILRMVREIEAQTSHTGFRSGEGGGVDTMVSSHGMFFITALRECEREGQWERAIALLQEMDESDGDISACSFCHAIGACETARQWEWAYKILVKMRRSLFPSSESITFTHVF